MTKEEMEKQIHSFAELMYKAESEDGVVKTEKINDKAYNDGYNKGLYDAWECVRKIALTSDGLSIDERKKIFGSPHRSDIFRHCTVTEAIAKIKEYEEKQKKIRENCSYLNDICPYDIPCAECEVHCSIARARQKLKGDKE